MADLSCDFVGIRSPNPFWLASAPPTDKAYNVNRAFEAGWGGVVWKTLGFDPPVVNVDYQTSLPGVWAGGDCVDSRHDLTVQAVEDGKRAAASIDRTLRQCAARTNGG